MLPCTVNAKHGREACAYRLDGEAAYPDALLPSARARLELEIAPPHTERGREDVDQLAVGRAADGRGGDPHAERVAMEPGQSGA